MIRTICTTGFVFGCLFRLSGVKVRTNCLAENL